MKITAVRTYTLKYDLPYRTGPSNYFYSSRETLLIKLETDEGLSGWGETEAFVDVRRLIEESYAPRLIGRNPVDSRRLWRELWGNNFGNGIALGGVMIAIDDLRGQALGVPIAELYGGRMRDRVPAYASAMNYIEGRDPREQYPREAAELVGRGFRALKMRLGGQPMRQDVATVAAVRDAVGPDVKLMADGNGAYTLSSAIQIGRELEQLGLYWFEEPLDQDAPLYAGYEVLANALDVAIAAGECLTSRGMFKEVITRRAMDIVQPDVSLVGGIGECLYVAEMARLWGLPCVPHCWAGAIAIVATTHLLSLLPDMSWSRCSEAPMLELDMVPNPFRDELLTTPLQFGDGFVSVPTRPGLGVEPDEEKLRFYARR